MHMAILAVRTVMPCTPPSMAGAHSNAHSAPTKYGSHQCLWLQQELEVARKRAFSVPSCSSLELPGSGALPCSQLSSHSFMLAGLTAAPNIPQISLLPQGPQEQV